MARDERDARLKVLSEALDADEFRPDDRREDWEPLRGRIRETRDTLAAAISDGSQGTAQDRAAVARLVGPVVALLQASGDRAGASAMLLAAIPLAPDPATHALWTAAERFLPAFVDLERARYHARRGERAEATRAAVRLHDHPAESLAKAALAIAGRRVTGGTGVAFYRERGFWVGVATFAALLAVFVVISHFQSPDQRVRREIAALRPPAGALSAEVREQRMAALESLIDREAEAGRVERATLAEAAVAMIEVMGATPEVGSPEVLRMLARLRALPRGVRTDVMLDRVSALVRGWIAVMRPADPGAAEAALRLCSTGRLIDGRSSSPLVALEAEVRGRLARRLLAEGWAADAFLQQTMRGEPDALAQAGQALRALPTSPSPWLALAPDLDTWLARAKTARPEDVAYAAGRLEAARQHARARAEDGRAPGLEGVDLPALDLLQARFPQDHEVAVARAEIRRSQGNLAAAIADLEALGPPGHLIRPAQILLADLLEETGKPAASEGLLDRIFALDFGPYEDARDRYHAAWDARAKDLRARPPRDIVGGVAPTNADAEKRLDAWVQQALLADPTVSRLRDLMKARSPVVDVALRLGMLRLGRALDESGDVRRATLLRAEQDFLAVSADAGGSVRYHLGLGQVYHRMNKADAGDRELQAVLDRHDPELDLNVVRVYRDLGLIPRATEIAVAVQGRAPVAVAQDAALVLSLMADRRSEEERWLKKADQQMPAVRANLNELEADRLFEQGELEAADAKYAEVLAIWLADAETDNSSANNGALAAARRYSCTGDAHHLDVALRLFDTSVRLAPSSAIAAGNAAPHFLHRARLALLQRWIDVAPLRLTPWQADLLTSALLRGPLHRETLTALKESPHARRALALYRREQLLAPRWVDGYDGQTDWYVTVGDEDGLGALVKRLADAPLELAQGKAAYDRRGQDDKADEEHEKSRQQLLVLLERLERTLPKAEASARARRTHAALWLLRGAEHSNNTDEAQAAFDAFVHARALWPELRISRMGDPAMTVALDEVGRTHPALGTRWTKVRPDASAELFVYDLLRAGDASALQALRASPSIEALAHERRDQLAAALRAGPAAGGSGMNWVPGQFADWCLGHLLNDPGLVAAGREYIRSPVVQSSAVLRVAMAPYSAEAQRWAAIVKEIAARRD